MIFSQWNRPAVFLNHFQEKMYSQIGNQVKAELDIFLNFERKPVF